MHRPVRAQAARLLSIHQIGRALLRLSRRIPRTQEPHHQMTQHKQAAAGLRQLPKLRRPNRAAARVASWSHRCVPLFSTFFATPAPTEARRSCCAAHLLLLLREFRAVSCEPCRIKRTAHCARCLSASLPPPIRRLHSRSHLNSRMPCTLCTPCPFSPCPFPLAGEAQAARPCQGGCAQGRRREDCRRRAGRTRAPTQPPPKSGHPSRECRHQAAKRRAIHLCHPANAWHRAAAGSRRQGRRSQG